MLLQEAISAVVEGQDLSREQSAEAMTQLMNGEGTPAQIGGLLVALRMKGETVEEITGFAETMRKMATRVNTSRSPLVDTCGTGGDNSGTFNISTTAAFVVAGAGLAVAKHGNRSVTSTCGSADVLEALGVSLDLSADDVGRSIDEVGIGFLFARALHGAMKHVAAPRMELKIRTVFNLLGPLTNPAGACGQVLGVFDAARVPDMAHVLAQLGTRHAFVVAGADGLDEITLSGPTHVAEAVNGEVKTYEITPETLGLEQSQTEALRGGDALANAEILRRVLGGEKGPHRDIVLANSAAALIAGERAVDWQEAMLVGAESIDSGAANSTLEALIEFTSGAKQE